jgi:hypothetical protein
MSLYIWDHAGETWVPAAEYRPPAHAATISVIRDEMDATLNHADGRHYTSKRRYEAEVRARGYTIIGNEDPIKHIQPEPLHRPGEVARDILRTMEQLRSR